MITLDQLNPEPTPVPDLIPDATTATVAAPPRPVFTPEQLQQPFYYMLSTLLDGVVVNMNIYSYDRYDRKKLREEIREAVVIAVVPPNYPLTADQIQTYYDSPDDITPLQAVNCYRVVLVNGTDSDGNTIHRVILCSRDFYNTSLLTVEVMDAASGEYFTPVPRKPIYRVPIRRDDIDLYLPPHRLGWDGC